VVGVVGSGISGEWEGCNCNVVMFALGFMVRRVGVVW
jgi:hypothetical protein